MLFKSVIVGIMSAFIPLAAIVFGVDIGIAPTLGNMLWFAVFGIMSYQVYASVNAGVKTVRLVMKPFTAMLGSKPKQKVIVKHVDRKDD